MLRIAVFHQDETHKQAIIKILTNALKDLKIYGKIYSIRDFDDFCTEYINGRYQFEILFLDTSNSKVGELMQSQKPQSAEYVLLDTPSKELSQYMRYKPIAWLRSSALTSEKMQEVIKACAFYINLKKENAFCVRTKDKSIRIPYSQILYFESRQHHIVVHTLHKLEYCAFSALLDDVAKVLPKDRFLRCHQSFLVNNDNIQQLDRTNRNLLLRNGSVVSISKRYYQEIDDVFVKESIL